ncbi:MAG: hypothetical protein M1828_005252 [Chrysothrix sp. TS-e1954]|nr:MAG: hypothetical protein M1828_005252 [Chrysothrix sp. TS-e1954]
MAVFCAGNAPTWMHTLIILLPVIPVVGWLIVKNRELKKELDWRVMIANAPTVRPFDQFGTRRDMLRRNRMLYRRGVGISWTPRIRLEDDAKEVKECLRWYDEDEEAREAARRPPRPESPIDMDGWDKRHDRVEVEVKEVNEDDERENDLDLPNGFPQKIGRDWAD